jgi:hypothetical protein
VEAVPDLDARVSLFQPCDQLQLPGEATVHGIVRNRTLKSTLDFVGVHAVQFFRTLRQTEDTNSPANVLEERVELLDWQSVLDPRESFRIQSQFGGYPLAPGVVFV